MGKGVGRYIRRLARRPGWSGLLIGVLAFVGSAGMSGMFGAYPLAEDEYSYLLAADTFAQGRLSNPPHPLWAHFESLHIIQQPSYMSKYPPGHGLVLALGQVLTGHALVGVWIGMAMACVAIYWMFLQWLPARWALLGGLLVVVRLVCFGPTMANDIVGYWGRSYWGGGVAAAGGALVFGAVRRIVGRHLAATPLSQGERGPSVTSSLLLAFGLAVLANTRPLEGAVACMPVAALLLVWMFGPGRPTLRLALTRVVLPMALVLTAAALWMGYYNWRGTGDLLRMPYQVHEKTYAVTPVLVFMPLPAPTTYNHETIRWIHEVGMRDWYLHQQTLGGFLGAAKLKLLVLWVYYFFPGLTPSLLALPWVLRQRWMRFALVPCGLVLAVWMLEFRPHPHYSAPITGLIFLFVVQGLRRLRFWKPMGRPWGRFIVRIVPVVLLAAFVGFAILTKQREQGESQTWPGERVRIGRELERGGGRHLIIVRYQPPYHDQPQWVHNRADIDAAPVVWAREMDREKNRLLLEYFHDRQVWLLEGDVRPYRLKPYVVSGEW